MGWRELERVRIMDYGSWYKDDTDGEKHIACCSFLFTKNVRMVLSLFLTKPVIGEEGVAVAGNPPVRLLAGVPPHRSNFFYFFENFLYQNALLLLFYSSIQTKFSNINHQSLDLQVLRRSKTFNEKENDFYLCLVRIFELFKLGFVLCCLNA
jgi:hypothetical protein